MCLYSETNKPKIAQQDIVCYKHVLKRKHHFRPYYHGNKVKYKFGKLYKIDVNLFINKVEKGKKWYLINNGFHSYEDIDTFDKKNPNGRNYCYIKCIIPKGSLYFEETHNNGDIFYYCSNQLYICNPPGNFFKRLLRKYIYKYKSNLI
jgi:hypothetical protein